MKKIISIFLLVFVGSVNAQTNNEEDIFEVDKKGSLVLKSYIDKKINNEIIPYVNQEIRKFKVKKEKELGRKISDNDEEVKFARDTIRIEAYIGAYETKYSNIAHTTIGMNFGADIRMKEYDKLLNEYYKKALSVLAPKMKNKLIESQRRWLNYYEKESDFIYELNDVRNHNTSIWSWGDRFQMLENRVLFLRKIFIGDFTGHDTYKEDFQGM